MSDRQVHKTPLRRRGRRPAAGRCPVCGAASRPESRPFCSRRCADVDLGRWLTGGYRIPTDETPGDSSRGDLDEDHE